MMRKPGRERLEEALSVAIESDDPLIQKAVERLAVLVHLAHGDLIERNLRERAAAMNLVARFGEWNVEVKVSDTPHSA